MNTLSLPYIYLSAWLWCSVNAAVQPHTQPNDSSIGININWDNQTIASKTYQTLQVVVNPLLLQNSSIHDKAFESLRLVSSEYVRYVPWFPYPRLAVPELEPPSNSTGNCSTSWDFNYMDEILLDFYQATPNVKHIINFSTIPAWMWITNAPVSYPDDINTIDNGYNQGTVLRDSSMKEVSDYFARIVSWYVNGGFTDECGKYHHSDHSLGIEYWEVLNEMEHSISPQYYNQIYDAVVTAIQKVSPTTKFIGLALGGTDVSYFESFLNPANHQPGIPLDFISYHYYAVPTQGSQPEEATMSYEKIDGFLANVQTVDNIRKRLSPSTKTNLDELGTFDPLGAGTLVPGYVVPDTYFVWSGGIFAYIFSVVANIGIDVVGESQLVGYPGQFPSVSMVNYTTGAPNARLRVLELLQKSFEIGDILVQTSSANETLVHGQAFKCGDGKKKVLLINKNSEAVQVNVTGFEHGIAEMVDVASGEGPWSTTQVRGSLFNISPYATVVLTMKK